MIPVVWLKDRKLCWDQHLLASWLDGPDFKHVVDLIPDSGGAVVVVPARYFEPTEINALIQPLAWVVLVLTSDEESLFDQNALTHPNMTVWTMTPRPGIHTGDRFLGEGFPDDTRVIIAAAGDGSDRPLDVFFSGQVTHDRRTECVAGIRQVDGAIRVVETAGFTLGLERPEYLRLLTTAKIAPCPSGPATPDSFRLYEALEAGCVPIADGHTPDPDYPDGYWGLVAPGAPFPVISDWDDLPKECEAILSDWPASANRCSAWWQLHKRTTRDRLFDDITALSDQTVTVADPDITVIVSTSLIPSHPSLYILATTLASVRERLPAAEILVTCDGVRAEQADRKPDYDEYLRRLLWACSHDWQGVTPLLMDRHQHQANSTRVALDHVRTPLVLFVEHDTPLEGDIDWPSCIAAVESGRANLIRFHHESEVLDVHRHLMLDTAPQDVEGAPLLRTVQWSQRPHLASTGFYRSIIASHFSPESRTMIEDTMHSVLESAWLTYREAGWQQYRTWMYAPDGNLRRSYHLDGRGDDPKFEMKP